MRRRIEELEAEIRLSGRGHAAVDAHLPAGIARMALRTLHCALQSHFGHRPCRANFGHELVFSLSSCSSHRCFRRHHRTLVNVVFSRSCLFPIHRN